MSDRPDLKRALSVVGLMCKGLAVLVLGRSWSDEIDWWRRATMPNRTITSTVNCGIGTSTHGH